MGSEEELHQNSVPESESESSNDSFVNNGDQLRRPSGRNIAGQNTIIPAEFWSITSVNVYTVKGYPIFSRQYNTQLSSFDSNVVLQFFTTVQTFAKSHLNTSLIDFKVKDERVFFRVDETYGHIYLITVKLSDQARSGLNSAVNIAISSLITDICSLLMFQNSETSLADDIDLNLKDAIDEMVTEINSQDLIERELFELREIEIGFTVITDLTGIPIFSRTYNDTMFFNEDPILITMFLHALNVFFNTNFSDALQEINFGNSRLYIRNKDDYFYALFLQFDQYYDLPEDSPIHLLSHELLEEKSRTIKELGVDVIEDISDDSLQLMIDNIIYRGMYQLNEQLKLDNTDD